MRGNWTVHGEKGQTSGGISIPKMDAGSSIYGGYIIALG